MAVINTYSALIERAISDFDKIFDALADKGVESNSKPLLKDAETLEGGIKKSDGLETSEYAGLITSELWKIEDLVGEPTLTGEKLIANFSTSTLSLNEKSSAISGNTLTLTLDGLQKGYYATGTTLTYTKALNTVEISGTPTASSIGGTGLSFDDTDKDYYKLVATTLPIASVNVKKGSVSGSIAQDDISATVTLDTAVTKAESGNTIANYTLNPTEAGTNVSKIKLSVVPSYTASVTAQAKLALSAGYITSVANPDAVTKEIEKSNGTASDIVIEVPNAVIDDVEVNGTIVATVPADLKYTHTEDDGAYKIDLAGTLSATDISGTAGYLADPSSIKFKASNAIESNEVYIKKGSVGSATTNAHTLTSLTTGAGKYANSKYTVPVSVSETLSKDVTPGYITATKFESELSGSTDVEIAGAVGAGVSATKSDLTKSADSSSIFTEADVDGAYKITLTGSVSYEKTLTTAGYLNSVAQIAAPATTEFSKTLSVAKGAVSSSATLDRKSTRLNSSH